MSEPADVDDVLAEPELEPDGEFVADPIVASWQRMMTLAKSDKKLAALAVAASDAAGLVRKGLRDKQRVVDELMQLVANIDDLSMDDVQAVIADAFQARTQPDEAEAKPNGAGKPLAPLPFIDMSSWDDADPPRREWLIEDYIPMRQPTIISGVGGIGKSILLLQLLAATALGDKWLDLLLPSRGPTIYLGAEDDQDEIHRRLHDILKHYNAKFSDLIEGGFHALSYAGEDAVLASFDRSARIQPTELYARLEHAARMIRPKAIVIDAVSDVFLGDEINRTQVRQFGSLMRKLSIDSKSSVIIASHPSLSGIKSGSGLSGSTQWHNTMRARAFFRQPGRDDDDASDDGTPDDGRRELDFKKNQYGPLGQIIKLKWSGGLWLPISEQAAQQFDVEDLFLQLLRRFAEQGRNVSDKRSPSYAPSLFADEPEAKAAKASKKALAEAMVRLFAANKIAVLKEGRPSHQTYRIVEKEDPANSQPTPQPTGGQRQPTPANGGVGGPPHTPPTVGRAKGRWPGGTPGPTNGGPDAKGETT
jgi:RecA-family ATPase